VIVLAHAGHWLAQAAYLAPLVVLVGILVVNRIRERRARPDGGADSAPAAGASHSGRRDAPPE
jgi:hypothetical protein